MKKHKWKIVSLLLSFSLVANALPVYAAYPNTLTMTQAVTSALKTSYSITKVKNDIVLKKISLQQAIQAIKDTRKKESTIKFSLLFNIKFPTGHALPKEIELIMKVPTIQSEIEDLTRKVENEKLKVISNTQNTYFNVLELMNACNTLESSISSSKSTYKKLYIDYAIGNAKKDDVDEVKSNIEKLEKEYQSNLLRYENAKKKLSELIGINVTQGYVFSEDFSTLKLQRGQLDSIVNFALSKDYSVYSTELKQKIAETEVEKLRNIYNSRWGSMVSVIESEIAKNGPIDYTTFIDKYQAALSNIERPYQGNYVIKILFITIKIPKEWFRSEFDGIRYFEDQKYALFISLMDRDAARKETQEIKKTLRSSIEDGFNTLLELWTSYEESKKAIDSAKSQYERVKKLNLTGQAQFLEVESAKNDVISAEQASYSALIAYNKTLASFDYTCAGAIDKLKTGVSLDAGSKLDSGLSWLDEINDADKPYWYLNTLIDNYKFVFGVKVPEESGLEVTHYELCTEDGKLIGQRTPINNTILHIPLVYEGTTKLIVKLYNDNKLAYISEIDAAEITGTLELKEAIEDNASLVNQLPSSGSVLGSWKVTTGADKFTSKLLLEFNSTVDAAFYSLSTETGNQINSEKLPVTTPLSHLSLLFADTSKLVVTVYDTKGTPLFDALLVTDGDVQVIKIK